MKATYKTMPNLMKFYGEGWKRSQQQTKFRHGKSNENQIGPFKKTFRNRKNLYKIFMHFQLSSELVIDCPILFGNKQQACEEPRLGLNQLNDGTDRWRVPLHDEDHPGNDPHLVPVFPRLCSGMTPERFRGASVTVGSE